MAKGFAISLRTLVAKAEALLAFRPELKGLGITFVVSVILLVIGQVLSSLNGHRDVVQEIDQLLHYDYATHFVPHIAPFLSKDLRCEDLRPVLEELEKQSHRFKLYVVDEWWMIRCSTKETSLPSRYEALRLSRVIHLLKRKEQAVPILLADPRDQYSYKPFSAADLEVEGARWYVVAVMETHELVNGWSGLNGVQRINKHNMRILSILALFLFIALLRYHFTKASRLRAKIQYLDRQLTLQRQQSEQHRISSLSQEIGSVADMLVKEVNRFGSRQEDKQTFIASLTHDLKSPLTAVKGYVDTLIRNVGDMTSTSYRHCLEVIEVNLDHVTSLITQILESESFEESVTSRQMTESDLNQALGQVYRTLVPIAEERSVSLTLQLPHPPLLVPGDKVLLIRAFTNLTHNALKFTPAGGKVIISAMPEGNRVKIRVEDTGCGIPGQDVSFVFQRFYRGSKTRKEKNGSAGLGLYIVRKIIEAHSGSVYVERTSEKGTTFCVELQLLGRESS